MKKYYFAIFTSLIFLCSIYFFGCSKDDNPVTNTTNSANGTLVFSSENLDSIAYPGTMVPRSFSAAYDFTNSDSVIFTFQANTKQISDNRLLKIVVWGDTGSVHIVDISAYCNWQTGNFDYRYANVSPQKRVTRLQYYLVCNSPAYYLAVRNLKIWKK
jgi:hypothetical protein